MGDNQVRLVGTWAPLTWNAPGTLYGHKTTVNYGTSSNQREERLQKGAQVFHC